MGSYEDLDSQGQIFVDKYLSTMDCELAAREAKYDRKDAQRIGLELLANNIIQEAIKERREKLNSITNNIEFTKEDLLRIYWDMFNDARKKGKLADAKSILGDIAKYNGVNPDEIKKEIAILNFNLDKDKI